MKRIRRRNRRHGRPRAERPSTRLRAILRRLGSQDGRVLVLPPGVQVEVLWPGGKPAVLVSHDEGVRWVAGMDLAGEKRS